MFTLYGTEVSGRYKDWGSQKIDILGMLIVVNTLKEAILGIVLRAVSIESLDYGTVYTQSQH